MNPGEEYTSVHCITSCDFSEGWKVSEIKNKRNHYHTWTHLSHELPPGDLGPVDQVVTAGVNLHPTLQRLSLFLWLDFSGEIEDQTFGWMESKVG